MSEKINLDDYQRQWLSFLVNNINFCVDILNVKEILRYQPPTKLYKAPESIIGIINLRELVIPIVDLNFVFNNKKTEIKDTTIAIIMHRHEKAPFGILIDHINDVIDCSENEIKKMPKIPTPTDYIYGIICKDDKNYQVLNLNLLLKDILND